MTDIIEKITAENWDHTVLTFRDRQAGISAVYDPFEERYYYNAYCIEKKLLKELWTQEYEYLDDAIKSVNLEFGSWDSETLEEKKGCGSCVAK
jgi:hypothetical protein